MNAPVIVCGTDLTSASERAAEFALNLARASSARLVLVHTHKPEAASESSASSEQLEQNRARCEAAGIACEALVRAGEPWEQLNEVASQQDANLLVVGRGERPRDGVRGRLIGSTADRLVRGSRYPVLMVPAEADAASPLTNAVWMVAVDFGDPALLGVRAAKHWANQTGGSLLLTHIIPPAGSPDLAESDRQFEEKANAHLAQLVSTEAPEAKQQLLSAHGVPADALLEAADNAHARVLVIGSQGRTGLPKFFLGSTAEQSLQKSTLPVLVVRP